MIYVWLVFLLILNLCWLGLVIFYLPGNWLIVISTSLFAWWQWDEGVFSIATLVVITLLAALGELVEFFSGMGGARTAGSGWLGALAAIGGAFAGAIAGTIMIPIPVVGTLIGTCGGAAFATWFFETAAGKKGPEPVRSGVGAGVGVFIGTMVKFMIGSLIWFIVAVAASWP